MQLYGMHLPSLYDIQHTRNTDGMQIAPRPPPTPSLGAMEGLQLASLGTEYLDLACAGHSLCATQPVCDGLQPV